MNKNLFFGLSQNEILWVLVAIVVVGLFGFYVFVFIPSNNKRVRSTIFFKTWIPDPEKDPDRIIIDIEDRQIENPEAFQWVLEDNIEPRLLGIKVHSEYMVLEKNDDIPWDRYIPGVQKVAEAYFQCPVEILKRQEVS